ncbi:MAG: ABC transporter ATP-binding protein [Pseudomonadota bacterium]
MPTTSDAFLRLCDLRKTYGSAVAIEHVSLDIRKGEFMTFLGPSGSGKSTTLYITAGFEDPTGGSVVLNQQNLLGVPPSKRNIGMVFQRYTLFPHLSVAENIAFPLRVRKWREDKIRDTTSRMLKLIHLDGFGGRKPSELSGGQQQRVAIARALAYDPPILLMDEPLSALDKKLREELQTELRRIHQETGVTVLYVTHDQEEALRLSDRIAVFNKGRIEQVGTGIELYEAPATRFVASFIGNSNFMPVEVSRSSGGASAVLTLPHGVQVSPGAGGQKLVHGRPATLMVRPDCMRLQALSNSASAGASVTVKVCDRSYLGDTVQYTVVTPWEQEINVRMNAAHGDNARWNCGDAASVVWEASRGLAYQD